MYCTQVRMREVGFILNVHVFLSDESFFILPLCDVIVYY